MLKEYITKDGKKVIYVYGKVRQKPYSRCRKHQRGKMGIVSVPAQFIGEKVKVCINYKNGNVKTNPVLQGK